MNIKYYAANSTMSENNKDDCCAYRKWATLELQKVYPQGDIEVLNEESNCTAWTDPEDDLEEVIDFCSRLLDRCGWDEMED